MSKRELTEKQKLFLQYLLEEKGCYDRAARRAGYSENTDTTIVVKSLKDEIVDLAKDYLAFNGLKAATSLTDVLSDPTALGNREKIKAATEHLDRIGVSRTEKVEHTGLDNSVVILPAKNAKAED